MSGVIFLLGSVGVRIRNPFKSLTRFDMILWILSLVSVISSAAVFRSVDALSLIASLIGVTALIFLAKGDVFGQILIVIFSVFYGIISIKFKYYGEMITYVFMTTPIAIASVVSWIRHPYKGNRAQVEISRLTKKKIIYMIVLALIVTVFFYFVLKFFATSNLIISTVSITTSFIAAYLTFFRSPAYALGYASNDVVLIVLWVLAAFDDIKYLPMVVCFSVFLVNDLYGFYSWRKMQISQSKDI